MIAKHVDVTARLNPVDVNQHSTVTHYQRPNMTHPQEGGTGGEVSEILFFSAKSKRRPSLIYSMQIIPVCLSIVARRKGVSPTRRGGLNWTPISLLVGHPCKLFHTLGPCPTQASTRRAISGRIPRFRWPDVVGMTGRMLRNAHVSPGTNRNIHLGLVKMATGAPSRRRNRSSKIPPQYPTVLLVTG